MFYKVLNILFIISGVFFGSFEKGSGPGLIGNKCYAAKSDIKILELKKLTVLYLVFISITSWLSNGLQCGTGKICVV